MVQALRASRWIARIMLLGLVLGASGCDEFEGQTILAWNDPQSGAQIEVKAAMRDSATRVHMQVTRAGKRQRLVLYDRASLHDAMLLHYNDWVLMLSGPYVLGGYDIQADAIEPYDSPKLPFTYYTLSGMPVAENRLADGDDPEPFNFHKRPDRP